MFALLRIMLAQEVFGHGGHDGAREDVGGEHGEADRFGEGHKQVFRDAAEQEHRHKHDAYGDGGNECGNGNLRGAVENRLFDGLALFEVAVDVFDFNGGIVDENADGKGKATESHDV